MIERKIVGMAPAFRLGMLRFIICTAALLTVCMERLSSFAEVSSVWMRPAGVLRWIPQAWMSSFLSSSVELFAFQAILIVVLALAAAGLWTRFALGLSTVLFLFYAGLLRSYGTYFSQGFVLSYLLFFLTFLPAGADFSLDAQWKRSRGAGLDLQPDRAMGWSVFLLRAVIALTCFQAAWAKLHLTGISWLESGNLKRILIGDNLNLMTYSNELFQKSLHLPESAWGFFGALVLLVEFCFPVVLISWGIRKYYPLLAAVVLAALTALCPAAVLDGVAGLCLLLIFYDWDRILFKHKLPSQDRRRQTPPDQD